MISVSYFTLALILFFINVLFSYSTEVEQRAETATTWSSDVSDSRIFRSVSGSGNRTLGATEAK